MNGLSETKGAFGRYAWDGRSEMLPQIVILSEQSESKDL